MTLTEAQRLGCCINHPDRPGKPYVSDTGFKVPYCPKCKRGHGKKRRIITDAPMFAEVEVS